MNYKVVFLGESRVGKTAFLCRHTGITFNPVGSSTVGAEIHYLPLKIDGKNVQFEIWDTAGNPKMIGMQEAYYYNADAAIFFYDAYRPNTYESLDRWKSGFTKIVGDKPIIVCATKSNQLYIKRGKWFKKCDDDEPFLALVKILA
uniref:Ras-related GTPase n=1 Tax=Marseillevirus LCMAC102 TaxID=2506603 RepID=A0A481YTN5_9VIRU|nr:MAG: Ras-related GTPase [Marseillevirus LCMAC102]